MSSSIFSHFLASALPWSMKNGVWQLLWLQLVHINMYTIYPIWLKNYGDFQFFTFFFFGLCRLQGALRKSTLVGRSTLCASCNQPSAVYLFDEYYFCYTLPKNEETNLTLYRDLVASPWRTCITFGVIWAATWEKVPSYMWAQRRLKSACASAQSDQSLRCPHEETLHPYLSKMRSVKILIRLCKCADRSESSVSEHARR